MKLHKKYKGIDIKSFIIPIIITTVLFALLGIYGVTLIEDYFYDEMKKQTFQIVKSYSYILEKRDDANKLFNELLTEKLTVLSHVITLLEDDYLNQINDLADILKVNEINLYNKDGIIVKSTDNEYIGWKADPGHPVNKFMESDKKSLVENIRPDSESGINYKYGYFRNPDGSFIQVGIKAENIHNMFSDFELNKILNQISSIVNIERITVIDNEFTIKSSTEETLINHKINDINIVNALEETNKYSNNTTINGTDYYRVITKISNNESDSSYLSILYPLNETNNIINFFIKAMLIILIIMYIIITYVFYLFYKKNKGLIKLAYYDKATNLPNKEYLMNMLKENDFENKKCALFLIRINNINLFNLTYGHEYGDELIKKLSFQLKNLKNEKTKLFRFEENKFILFYENYKDDIEIHKEVNKIRNNLDESFKKIEFDAKYLSANIAVEKKFSNYQNEDKIINELNSALDYSKKGNSPYIILNQQMKNKINRKNVIEDELKELIKKEDNRLYLEFQPMLDLKGNSVVAFEALARMNSKNYGMISPAEFIQIAEEKHLISDLSKLILKKAAMFSTKLERFGIKNIQIAVNMSGIDIIQDRFTEEVISIIKDNDAKTKNIKMEITESILLNNFELINSKLAKLKDAGITIALDDFGTGYSSLYRLSELNIDVIKIDRSFINKITNSTKESVLTSSIINMSHTLGLSVVAEGVELEAEKDYLIKHDCDIMQGYLFSKPLTEKDAVELLKD